MGKMITRSEAAKLLGREPQTVSNWLEAGILKGKKTTRWTMIDEDSILKLSDSLQTLADMEENVRKAMEEKRQLSEKLTEEVRDLRHSIRILHFVGADKIRADFFKAVTDAALNAGLIGHREHYILSCVIANKSLDAISRECYVTRARILQITGKALEKIAPLGNYNELRSELVETKRQLEAAGEVIRNKDMEIAELRKMTGTTDESDETDLSEPEEIVRMRELLNTRLVDMGLSTRTLNCLRCGVINIGNTREWVEIETLGDLVQCSKTYLLKIRNFGKASLRELDNLLDSLNLSFDMNVSKYMKKGAELEYKGYGRDC